MLYQPQVLYQVKAAQQRHAVDGAGRFRQNNIFFVANLIPFPNFRRIAPPRR
jgi:hypothetical protein